MHTLRVLVSEGPDAGASYSATAERVTVGTANGNDLVLTDPTVSRYHLEIAPTPEGVSILDPGSTNGLYVGAVRVSRGIVAAGTHLTLGRTVLRVLDGETAEVDVHAGNVLGGMRGRTPLMRRLMAQVERAAQSSAALLLVGESGTGKEVVARAVHELGPRAAAPFVTVDCGALAPTLVASELFGHERGAFTGAERQHEGAFERAHGGTLFLDEIGELPLPLQATLLGALERRRFRRLGGKTELAVDVRVVSATHRDLRGEVNRDSFRLDLYYRLAVVVLTVPPLREHVDDIPLLVEHFLRESGLSDPLDRYFSAAALGSLTKYFWPGNVRELRNFVEATVAMGESPELSGSARPDAKHEAGDPIEPLLTLPYGEARAALLKNFEKRYLGELVTRVHGNVSRAAREARMDRSHLIELLKRHDIR